MKLSKKTYDILKNFATICPSISIEKGNILRTISEQENIVAYATVKEYFPIDFSIYDLNQFINSFFVVKSVDEADLIFDNEHYLTIQNGNMNVKYFFTDKSFIKEVPAEINFPNPDLCFKLTEMNISGINRAKNVHGVEDLSIIAKGGNINVVAWNKKSETSNNFSICVAKIDDDVNLRLDMKTENLKLFDGDYNVRVSQQRIAMFEHVNMPLVYYIALEK